MSELEREMLKALRAVEAQAFCDCGDNRERESDDISHEPGCFVPIVRAAIAKAERRESEPVQ